MRNKKIRVENSEYAVDVTINILLEPAEVEDFLANLTELTAANFLAEELAEILIPVAIKKIGIRKFFLIP